MIDIRLRSFLEVWRRKSFTKAAESLHLTQPAVSQHIRHLERDLGCKLFIKEGRTIEPTPEGLSLLRFARMVEAEALRTREWIRSLPEGRDLRFGATRTIGEFVMPAPIAAWNWLYPKSRVRLVVDNSAALFAALDEGKLDFIFVEGAFDREAYSVELLFRDVMVPICAPGHRFAGQAVGFDDVLREPFIVREEGSGSRSLIERALADSNRAIASFSSVLEIGNIGAIKALVADGVGCALLYHSAVARELEEGSLARFSIEGLEIAHDYSFASLKASPREAEFKAFLEHCRRCVSARGLKASGEAPRRSRT